MGSSLDDTAVMEALEREMEREQKELAALRKLAEAVADDVMCGRDVSGNLVSAYEAWAALSKPTDARER